MAWSRHGEPGHGEYGHCVWPADTSRAAHRLSTHLSQCLSTHRGGAHREYPCRGCLLVVRRERSGVWCLSCRPAWQSVDIGRPSGRADSRMAQCAHGDHPACGHAVPGESTVLGGVQVTTHARTVFDIGRRVHTSRAVELIDVLLRNCSMSEVREVASRHRGVRGTRRLMNVLSLADPGAESVQETRLRMCLVGAGLPRPETQIELCGPDGRTIRLDMGWREQRVAAEFDGAQHWGDSAQHRRDIERQETIAAMGWRLVRVSRDQLINQPLAVVHRVRAALSAASRAA